MLLPVRELKPIVELPDVAMTFDDDVVRRTLSRGGCRQERGCGCEGGGLREESSASEHGTNHSRGFRVQAEALRPKADAGRRRARDDINTETRRTHGVSRKTRAS